MSTPAKVNSPPAFKRISVPLRTFYCELKNRPPEDSPGDIEELIDTLDLQVPRLKDSELEKQWAIALMWNKLYESEFVNRGINQVFIFTAKADELIIRLESTPFDDEPSQELTPPDNKAFEWWQRKLEARFKGLYGITIEQWQEQNR